MAEDLEERVGPVLLALALFVAGVIFGALAVGSVGETDRRETMAAVTDLFRGLARGERPLPPLVALGEAARDYVRLILLYWALGLSVVGSVVALGETFLRGFAAGFAAGFLGAELGWRGIAYSAAALLPQGVLTVPGLAAAAGGTVHFAALLAGGRARKNRSAFYAELSRYTRWMALSLFLLLCAALVEAYAAPVLMGLAGRIP